MTITVKEVIGVLTLEEKAKVERLEKIIDKHIREGCSFGPRIFAGWTINLGYVGDDSSSIHASHELARRYGEAGWLVRFKGDEQRNSIIILSITSNF